MALGSAWKQMSWLYYQYLLVTALYMLEPWERTVFKWPKYHLQSRVSKTGFCPRTGCICHRWARSARCCTDAAQTQWPRELMVRGSAVCLAAACAPESEVSADTEAWIYSMLVSIVGMALYTGYVFMPQHIMAILHYFEIVQ